MMMLFLELSCHLLAAVAIDNENPADPVTEVNPSHYNDRQQSGYCFPHFHFHSLFVPTKLPF